jgi:hypothetical protein
LPAFVCLEWIPALRRKQERSSARAARPQAKRDRRRKQPASLIVQRNAAALQLAMMLRARRARRGAAHGLDSMLLSSAFSVEKPASRVARRN